MSLKGYVVPVAVIVGGVAIWGFPKVREQVREFHHGRHETRVEIVQRPRAAIAWNQAGQADSWCRASRGDRQGWHCEVREFTVPAASGVLDVDAGGNGDITVEGWARADVFVRAKVEARARDLDVARELVSEVDIVASGDRIRAVGPQHSRRQGWAVSFRLNVPQRSDLALTTVNGGISVEDVAGDIRFQATNGGISLLDVGGAVRGRTTNGGIEVALAGDRWSGSGLDVQTTNGGIALAIPEDFNAELESGTVNGHLSVDFPVTLQGKIGRRIRTQIGEGGPLVRAVTTNGGVEIRRR